MTTQPSVRCNELVLPHVIMVSTLHISHLIKHPFTPQHVSHLIFVRCSSISLLINRISLRYVCFSSREVKVVVEQDFNINTLHSLTHTTASVAVLHRNL